METKHKPIKRATFFTLLIIFFFLSILGAFSHELWLDEAHHWLLARDSASLTDLIHKTREEGHPLLWNVLLFFISRVTTNPLWMQLFHAIIATIAAYFFLKNAPFKVHVKVLFIFGYYMLFEYNLLSRNYMIGVVFLFAACSLYQYRKERTLLLFSLLVVASNSHAMFVVISAALVLIIMLEHIQQKGFVLDPKMLLSLGVFVLGICIALFQIVPSWDNVVLEAAHKTSWIDRSSKSIIGFFKGVIALPDFRLANFWNSNLFINISKPLSSVLGILSLSIPLFLFYKNKLVLYFAYSSILGIFILFYITQLSAARYQGIFFLILIIGSWINHYHASQELFLKKWFSFIPLAKLQPKLILGLLLIQFITGFTAYSMDIARPFTNAKRTIRYLKDQGLDTKIIASKACDGTALSAYLERPIFFTNYNALSSYCVWEDASKVAAPSQKTVLQSLRKLLKNQSESLIFISYQPFFSVDNVQWNTAEKEIHYRFLKKFENSILTKGNYYIYEMVLP